MIYRPLNLLVEAGKLQHLISAHSKEIFGDTDTNLDLNHAYALINAGIARAYVSVYQDKIIGYTFYVLSRDFFNADTLRAECLAIYVKPEFRGTSIAKKLMAFAENALATVDKVTELVITTGNQKKFEKFYGRMGYSIKNVQMTKGL